MRSGRLRFRGVISLNRYSDAEYNGGAGTQTESLSRKVSTRTDLTSFFNWAHLASKGMGHVRFGFAA
jgi:hypothetical protein